MIRFICASILITGLALQSPAMTTGGTRPALELTEVYDWGTVRAPKSGYLTAEIRFRNGAEQGPLEILEVKPGCGCTTAELGQKVLAPGEETVVRVKLNINASQNGPLQRNVAVRSVHGSDTSQQSVTLKVDIQRLVSIAPAGFAAINDARVGSPARTTITIVNPGMVPVAVSNVRADDGMTVDIPEAIVLAPKEQRQVTLVYTPTKSGRFQSMLRFTSSDGKESDDIEIPTYGTALN